MKTKIGIFSSVISVFLSVSCGQAVSHEKEVAFYITLTKIRVKTAEPVNNCHQYMNFVMMQTMKAQKNELFDTSTIALLRQTYSKGIRILDSAISALNLLDEIDPEINLKQKMITYCMNSKHVLQTHVPQFINFILSKNGDITNDDRIQLNKYSINTSQSDNDQSSFDDLLVSFRDKHHITGEDLRGVNYK